jgi:hypothetical protein
MRKTLVAVLMMAALPLAAQEQKKPDAAPAADPMAAYIEMAKPVAEHKRLEEMAGRWNVTTSLWFDPAGKPVVSSGTGVGRMILGGRFLSLENDVGGQLPSQSLTIYGFDRRTNDFTLVGYDTLGTYYIEAAGKRDEAQNGIVLHGSYLQPPANREQKYRFVWTRPSADEHLTTLHFLIGEQWVRIAETRMTRAR